MRVVYCKIKEEFHQNLLSRYLALFNEEYQNKILRFHRWQDAQLSILGRLLLKKEMTYLGYTIDFEQLQYTEFNKPYFENTNIEFNISHSGNIVIIVIADKNEKIGIDIEKNQSIRVEDFENQMTNKEVQIITNSPNETVAFYNYWTEKEAVIKANGSGLQIPLKSFEVVDKKTIINNRPYFLMEISINDEYVCNICSSGEIQRSKIKLEEVNIESFI